MTAAEVIKNYRIENGLDQTTFGDLLKVTQSTVSLWERGFGIEKDNCATLAKLTGAPIMIFLTAGMKQEETA